MGGIFLRRMGGGDIYLRLCVRAIDYCTCDAD